MKIKGFIINDRNYIIQKALFMFIIYIIGICLGAIYCTFIATQADDSLHSYLLNFFSKVKEELPYLDTLKSSIFKNIKLFLILFICSYFRFGFLPIILTVGIKGFVVGFSSGIFIKYYSLKGILLCLSSLPSYLIFLPIFLLFSSASFIMSLDRKSADNIRKRKYLLLSICTLTIFCASSLIDSFITTTFMKIISPYFSN